MPAILLTNVCTALGHVNGARGTAVGIDVDPHGMSLHILFLPYADDSLLAEFFEVDDLYILCTRPPACVLFHRHNATHSAFTGLEPNVIPVFPLEKSITIKGYSVRRTQVPICPAFSLTDYKVQGSTLTTAVLDLKDDPTIGGKDSHRKYCSTYVQLSRLRASDGLNLLQRIDMEDLRFQPDPDLLVEMTRLFALEQETMAWWAK
jgi:hypothetical protein